MRFTDILKSEIEVLDAEVKRLIKCISEENGNISLSSEESEKSKEHFILNEAVQKKKPEDVLRGNNYKIKLVTPTSFGTQIDFAKKYNDDEIEEVLKDFNIKIKGKSVFVID